MLHRRHRDADTRGGRLDANPAVTVGSLSATVGRSIALSAEQTARQDAANVARVDTTSQRQDGMGVDCEPSRSSSDAPPSGPVPMTSAWRVRGRDAELTVIGSHLDRLLSGVGTVVVLEGHAGMGKSRLLAEVAGLGKRLDMLVGRGNADPGDTIVQLAPLMEALFEGPAPILDRAALTEAHTPPEQRYWLLQDIEAALERAALESPVLICLDDLQWADVGTAAALRTLPSRLSAVPVGWIIATRPGSGSPSIRSAIDLLEREGAQKVMLGPLDHAAVAQLAADLLVAEPDDPLLGMVERAGGSPFLLVELLWGLRDEQLVRIRGGKAELIDSRVPERVGESMRGRLDRASEPARKFAIVAGSLGRRFSLDDVAAMMEMPPSALLVALEELIHDNLLIEQDGQIAFGHDLTLEAVRERLRGGSSLAGSSSGCRAPGQWSPPGRGRHATRGQRRTRRRGRDRDAPQGSGGHRYHGPQRGG